MEVINYENIQETVYHKQLKNGLNVFLLPKPGFTKTYGLFSTRFGSVDTTFVPIGEKDFVKVPDGIAHFLEHKMFEDEEGDVSELFAQLGASTNAFTSFARTCYLFSTATNVPECIALLLDFVQHLYITDESIEKEKGIINQEIGMYDDDPDWQVYFSSIRNLYHEHPVKIDIAGTVETVSNIYKEDLEKCYNTFYHPSNMMLFVVGNIDADTCMSLIEENQNAKTFPELSDITRKKISEPETVCVKDSTIDMDIAMEQLILSFKVNDLPDDPKEKLKQEVACNLLLDILFSASSYIYDQWEKEGLINDSFGGSYTRERDYGYIQVGGESENIDALEKKLLDLFSNLSKDCISEEDFKRVQRKNYGHMITLLNSPEAIANSFTKYYHEGSLFFDIFEVFNTLTLDDVYNAIALFDLNNASVTKLVKRN